MFKKIKTMIRNIFGFTYNVEIDGAPHIIEISKCLGGNRNDTCYHNYSIDGGDIKKINGFSIIKVLLDNGIEIPDHLKKLLVLRDPPNDKIINIKDIDRCMNGYYNYYDILIESYYLNKV